MKRIPLSPEVRKLTGIEADHAEPVELMRALLKAQVDLLWFGGIGTYVKSSQQNHSDVGDKATDALRIDGKEIGAKVVGEGANLGMTQAGRIEYAQAGGCLNTDAIDNSAGVDTSDHEVNLKILLNASISAGELKAAERDPLLVRMTDEVGRHVLPTITISRWRSALRKAADIGSRTPMAALCARLSGTADESLGRRPAVQRQSARTREPERRHDAAGACRYCWLMRSCNCSANSIRRHCPTTRFTSTTLKNYFPAEVAREVPKGSPRIV